MSTFVTRIELLPVQGVLLKAPTVAVSKYYRNIEFHILPWKGDRSAPQEDEAVLIGFTEHGAIKSNWANASAIIGGLV
jgi:hypothetical protein